MIWETRQISKGGTLSQRTTAEPAMMISCLSNGKGVSPRCWLMVSDPKVSNLLYDGAKERDYFIAQ